VLILWLEKIFTLFETQLTHFDIRIHFRPLLSADLLKGTAVSFMSPLIHLP